MALAWKLKTKALVLTTILAACGSANSDSGVSAIEDDACYSPLTGHPTSNERSRWTTTSVAYAQEAERLYGVPAGALLAMSAIESGYGWTKTALNANNPFGFKYTSSAAAGGRSFYTLTCQPAADPNNRYIVFANTRDAFLFVAERLATASRYRGATDQYKARGGASIIDASNRWIDGISDGGYNYNPATYKVKLRQFSNNYMAPSSTYSAIYNTYKYSGGSRASSPSQPVSTSGGVSFATPGNGSSVVGEVPVNVNAPQASQVKLYSRAANSAGAWYLITTDSNAPFSINWVTAPYVPNGSYDLRAEAYSGATLIGNTTIRVNVVN